MGKKHWDNTRLELVKGAQYWRNTSTSGRGRVDQYYGARGGGFDLRVDEEHFRQVMTMYRLMPQECQRILVRVINKVGRAGTTRVVRAIAGAIRVSQSTLRRKNIRYHAANYRRLEGRIRVTGRRIALIQFSPSQTRKGVSYKIGRTGRGFAPHAFIAAVGAGHKGVFLRTGEPRISRRMSLRTSRKTGRKKGLAFLVRPRLPITELHGPSVPAAFESVDELARNTFSADLAHRLDQESKGQIQLFLDGKAGYGRAAATAAAGASA